MPRDEPSAPVTDYRRETLHVIARDHRRRCDKRRRSPTRTACRLRVERCVPVSVSYGAGLVKHGWLCYVCHGRYSCRRKVICGEVYAGRHRIRRRSIRTETMKSVVQKRFIQQQLHEVYVKTMSEPKTEASLRLTQFSHGGG